ncbi:hypothetical protein SAMN04487943_102482 [Gracilibacillus orientalis]|uniref:Uncharacterized protein n=1 Tax=Gracilibacillus orientalis TaxID=334253 RepID=A0A1I4J5T7_9BACI|nr:hypothetical protein [Gracilibacillus orientalis]SFL61910.1 hypothetical protein SAMN04487943_102482 [Gracilibacillus orientalis]
MKRNLVNKKSIFTLGLVLVTITIFLYKYYESISYFGFVEVRDLKYFNNEFTVTFEGDFGVKTSVFAENDYFNIIENDKARESNIAEIWDYLSEGESLHVLVEAYSNRSQFDLEKIYID